MASHHKSTVETLDNVFSKRCAARDFHLWLDRQKRPTLGASVQKGVGKSRHEVEDRIFSDIVGALTKECKELIPSYLMDVYFTYSMGSWQRSCEFHMKVHLTAVAFLSLTDELCHHDSLGSNPLHDFKKELEKREKNDHHGEKLRELFANQDCMHDLHEEREYHIAIVSKLDYPVLCLYHGTKSTAIPATQLPAALKVLETFIFESWGQEGFSIGMVIESADHASETSPMHFQVAAIVEEKVFAEKTNKDEATVKKSWGWAEPKRKYH